MAMFVFIFLFMSNVFGEEEYTLKLNIYSSTSSAPDFVLKGVELFFNLVERHCLIKTNTSIKIEPEKRALYPWAFSSSFEEYIVDDEALLFKFYQKSAYDYFEYNGISKDKNSIGIVIVDELERHCGFAFPPIQFETRQWKILDRIGDAVIINQNMIGCGRKERIVAHELAHIFLQDNPPHTCWDELGQEFKKCDSSNLLSTQVERSVVSSLPNRFGGGRVPDDPFAQDLVPSFGTNLTAFQCLEIKKSLENRFLPK